MGRTISVILVMVMVMVGLGTPGYADKIIRSS
jgi:hypothetical protein